MPALESLFELADDVWELSFRGLRSFLQMLGEEVELLGAEFARSSLKGLDSFDAVSECLFLVGEGLVGIVDVLFVLFSKAFEIVCSLLYFFLEIDDAVFCVVDLFFLSGVFRVEVVKMCKEVLEVAVDIEAE